MSIRTILVPAGPGVDIRPRLDALLPLVHGARGHIGVVFFHPDPGQVLASLRGLAIAVDATLAKLEADTGAAFAVAAAALDGWCARNAIRRVDDPDEPGPSASLTKRVGDLGPALAVAARLSDLVVLERPDGVSPFAAQAFDAAVFSGGRLSMVVPPGHAPRDVPDPLDHVLVAWNGSLEATRALAQAMPVLKVARRVSIFAGPRGDGAPQPAAELATYLRWHEIAATHVHDPSLGTSTGERILRTAEVEAAGLIVMGAYTHSRARQYFLGGATQHLLNHSHVPLLMAH